MEEVKAIMEPEEELLALMAIKEMIYGDGNLTYYLVLQ